MLGRVRPPRRSGDDQGRGLPDAPQARGGRHGKLGGDRERARHRLPAPRRPHLSVVRHQRSLPTR
ncbi:hypothetical protein PSCLAVI8L_100200 [Pseudoclavibacter sp. 8L]|nr:hypothetical protein PSCLAVI8L_100200 [Pseudoclavibacter sp. 8L]